MTDAASNLSCFACTNWKSEEITLLCLRSAVIARFLKIVRSHSCALRSSLHHERLARNIRWSRSGASGSCRQHDRGRKAWTFEMLPKCGFEQTDWLAALPPTLQPRAEQARCVCVGVNCLATRGICIGFVSQAVHTYVRRHEPSKKTCAHDRKTLLPEFGTC